jgi:hypothetical protein
MKVKYGDGETPLRNKHAGYTFIPSNYGQSALSNQHNDRKRYYRQWLRMQCNQKAVTNWRNMDGATQTAWNTFASTYPQPSKADPDVFLTGYQLFVKRNYYQFLHEGIEADFIMEPELSELPDPDFSVSVTEAGMCLDVTAWYVENFGIIPQTGQYVLCRVIPMATNSGQFFAAYEATLEVLDVYIDGLFLTLNFIGDPQGLEFSVYLSKPVRAGVKYQSTKFRFMGCFKPTQFIQLTDTPDEYTGQAGKFVAVNETEDGVEFVEGGGGGITCDDLINCDLIQEIISDIELIVATLNSDSLISDPPIKFGLLYNAYCAYSAYQLTSSDDWLVATYLQRNDLTTYVGGLTVAGGILKINSSYAWNDPNSGATNDFKFNCVGGGHRDGFSGLFSGIQGQNFMRFKVSSSSANSSLSILYNSVAAFTGVEGTKNGASIRLVKLAPGIPDGTLTSYLGNNGIVYRAVCINEIFWLADNLAETEFRDGSPIPEVTGNAAWAALTSPGMCAYDNDWINV